MNRIRIAVCDDNAADLQRSRTLLQRYFERVNESAEIHCFSDTKSLWEAVLKGPFSLYFLDVIMPNWSGIQIGKLVRDQDEEAQIIFVSSSQEFALQSFAARPLGYLVKPIAGSELDELLTFARNRLQKAQEKIAIKTRDGIVAVAIKNIIFCEYTNHTIIYHLKNGRTITATSSREPFAKQIEILLEKEEFVQPHSSYICNLQYVNLLTKTEFLLDEEKKVPVSKRLYKNIRERYLSFMFAAPLPASPTKVVTFK